MAPVVDCDYVDLEHGTKGFGDAAIASTVFGKSVDATITSALEQVIFGVMIIMFLIFEPLGFARLWQLTKERLRLWPFRH